MKILVAGLGWAMAELVLTRLVFLWVGARGVEFDWRYIQAINQSINATNTRFPLAAPFYVAFLLAELVLTRLVFLWVGGAKGVEFDRHSINSTNTHFSLTVQFYVTFSLGVRSPAAPILLGN